MFWKWTLLCSVRGYGITTSNVWEVANEFDGIDRVSIGADIRRLLSLRLIERGTLHHRKFYFVPTHAGSVAIGKPTSKPGLLSEAAKIKYYARLIACCREKPIYQPASSLTLIKRLGESYRGIADRFLVNPDDG
jgi:hypothetical protein